MPLPVPSPPPPRDAGLPDPSPLTGVTGPEPARERVLLVSVDGVAPRFVAPEGMPNLCGLARQGAGCFTARTVTPPWTRTAHASLLRGSAPGVHRIFGNSGAADPEGPPSVLAAARAAGLTTAAATCWTQLDSLIEPAALTHRLFVDAGYDPADDRLLIGQLGVLYAHSAPDVTFAYLAAPDLAGHDHGWGSPEYLDALAHADTSLGLLLEAAGPETAVVVTTDHGGISKSHDLDELGDAVSEADVLETFVVVRSQRLQPGSMWAQASILDVAPTVADLAGFAADPDWAGTSLIGRQQPMAEHLLGMIEALAAHSYGENLSMLSHVLQTAEQAQDRSADDELVVAALLHDIGHLLGEAGTHGRPDHAELGAAWLRPWLPATITEPIRLHVAAKRHLVGADPGYADRLSSASRITLAQQGGPFGPAESERFLAEPHAARAMLLRECDDAGKQPETQPGKEPDGQPRLSAAALAEQRPRIEAALAAGPVDPAGRARPVAAPSAGISTPARA